MTLASPHLLAAVPAVPGLAVDFGRGQEADVVVVTQRVRREATDASEAPDRQKLVAVHELILRLRVARRSSARSDGVVASRP